MTSSSCNAVHEQPDVGDEDPSDGSDDGGLEILWMEAIATKSSEGVLDDPAAGEHLEAFCGFGTTDDLDGPLTEFGAELSYLPVCALWANRWRSQGKKSRMDATSGTAPSGFWTLAPGTIAASRDPMVSSRICRLRPFTVFPAS